MNVAEVMVVVCHVDNVILLLGMGYENSRGI
jgi:hypothetical protein